MSTLLTPLRRSSLKSEIQQVLERSIADVEIPPATKVNEAELARQVGASRTPVREALLSLEARGFVRSDAGKGFYTATVSFEQASELYPILAALECLALRLGGPPGAEALAEMGRINRELTAAPPDSQKRLKLDNAWHERLLARCTNRQLLAEIARLKSLLRRYEILYMRDEGRVATSVDQHASIAAALERGRLAGALRELERNWTVTFEQLAPWLERLTPLDSEP